MSKLKVLNLYAGIGGNRKLWDDDLVEVTAIEYNQEIADVYKTYFPKDKMIVTDAKDYLTKNYMKFDFIWASPPCQSHSKMRYLASKRGSYDAILPNLELYELVIFLKHFAKDKKWVVENVKPYYHPLIEPTGKLGRHLIWCNFDFKEKNFKDGLTNNERGMSHKGVFDLRKFKLKHRKDQLIRNCVNPKLGLYLLACSQKETKTK
jgi:DNA (cytosine-5)-methyltransferase 1